MGAIGEGFAGTSRSIGAIWKNIRHGEGPENV
jgi:hypothetical protein